MKRLAAAALGLLGAAPALASGGYMCSAADRPIEIAIVTGHGVAPVIAQVRLTEGEERLSTAGETPRLTILQSWIDEREIRLDLVDPDVRRFEGRLRAKLTGPLSAEGTFERDGKTYRLRCSGEQ